MRSVTVQLNTASFQTPFELSLNLKRFVTLSEMLSTTLADLPGSTNEVYPYIYRCYPMPHDFFRGWVQFETLSQTYVSGTLLYHPGYCPAIDSHDWIS